LNKDKMLTAALFDGGINAGVFEARDFCLCFQTEQFL